ncbi:MAG: DNA repair protein RadC [Alphaproteobacteria bacterium]|nr:DNA repair protein RadC [Alphaproteobacteria bacterium]
MAELFPKEENNTKPHYTGHRDRLRQRFVNSPDSLPDYELLELLLFIAIPRKDVKPIAKELIDRFQNINGVLNASLSDLQTIKGISENTAIALKAIQKTGLKILQQDIMGRPILNSWQRLTDYCMASMANENKEHFRLLFLNKKNELIADEVQQTGTVDHTPAYPREIMKRSLELGATALILVHNHPSGDPSPSDADIHMTRAIMEAGKPFDIIVHDHLIVSRNGTSSFKTMGLM